MTPKSPSKDAPLPNSVYHNYPGRCKPAPELKKQARLNRARLKDYDADRQADRATWLQSKSSVPGRSHDHYGMGVGGWVGAGWGGVVGGEAMIDLLDGTRQLALPRKSMHRILYQLHDHDRISQ